MKLVHKSLTASILAACAAFGAFNLAAIAQDAGLPPYIAYYNPENGFKPAQRNFQNICLQLAGSLEHHGTPELYLRHVFAEAELNETAYFQATGKKADILPAYFTADYLNGLVKGWNQMAPTLGLENFCRSSGRSMRWAIMGSWNKSVEEIAVAEKNLEPAELDLFRQILRKPYFSRSDLKPVNALYERLWDKLSDNGKAEISYRLWRGTLSPEKRDADIENDKGGTMILAILREHQTASLAYVEGRGEPANADTLQKLLWQKLRLAENAVPIANLPKTEKDAIRYSHAIKDDLDQRLAQVRSKAPKELSDKVEKAVSLMLENIVVMVQVEYEAGLYADIIARKN